MVQKDPQAWPGPLEMERLLMNTVKEADTGALFLRRMLHMNPAYGQYLASDEDLSGIVQLFAKRFRCKILASEYPIQLGTLYEPLCEIVWRTIGHVLHTIVDLQNSEQLPVPKEAAGQVRMLLQTNLELSNKLNEMRRAYLRELSMHRDKQRMISEKAERALKGLQEEPIMFYEPLAFILDEQTKAFVREVVEEKIKLEQQTGLFRDDLEDESIARRDAEDLVQQLKSAQAEMRALRTAAAREQEASKRAVLLESQAREEAEKAKLLAEENQAELAELRKRVPFLEEELTSLRQQLRTGQEVVVKTVEVSKTDDVQVEALQAQLRDSRADVATLRSSMDDLYQQLRAQEQELAEEREKVLALQQQVEEQVFAINRARSRRNTAKGSRRDEIVPVPLQSEEEARATVLAQEMKEQAEKHVQVEQELRAANRALERALEEERARNGTAAARSLGRSAGGGMAEADGEDVGAGGKARPKSGKQKAAAEEHVERAVKAVSVQFERKIREQEQELDELRRRLEQRDGQVSAGDSQQAHGDSQQAGGEAADGSEAAGQAGIAGPKGDAARGGKKAKRAEDKHREELEEHIVELENENESLRQQVAMLQDKLRDLAGEDAVTEVMSQVRRDYSPVRKKKKKQKAYERLYEDAQRRIIEMRMREKRMRELEQLELMEAAKKVRNRRNAHQVEMLGHLQKAAEATRARFHDALANFHDKNVTSPRLPRADESGAVAEQPESEAEPQSSPSTLRVPKQQTFPRPVPEEAVVLERLAELQEENGELRDENTALQAEVERLKQALAAGPALQSRPIIGRNESSPLASSFGFSSAGFGGGWQPSPSSTGRLLSPRRSPAVAEKALGASGPVFGALGPKQQQQQRGLASTLPARRSPSPSAEPVAPDSPEAPGGPPPQTQRSLARTTSAQAAAAASLAGKGVLLLGSEPPWRSTRDLSKETSAVAADLAMTWGGGPVPPGAVVRGPGPEWAPHVLGRVPSAPLEPLRSRSALDMEEQELLEAQQPSAVRVATLAPSARLPDVTQVSADVRGRPKIPKPFHKGPAAAHSFGFVDEPKPMQGFCVTPLRSQEALVSLNGGPARKLVR